MGYRDDREALRQRNAELEAELQRARGEIEKLKGHPPQAIDVARGEAPLGRADRPGLASASLVALAGALSLLAEIMGVPVAMAALPFAFALLIWLFSSRFVVIAGPHEAIVLSGVSRRRPDGTSVGYRVVHSRRTLRRPVVEAQSRLDLGLFVVEAVAADVAMRAGPSAELRLGACAKVDAEPQALERAVERFLDRDHEDIAEAVRGAAIASTRQVCATQSFEAACKNPEALAAAIREETERELSRVGLTLWTLELFSLERAE